MEKKIKEALLLDLYKNIGIEVKKIKDLNNILFPRDSLLTKNIIKLFLKKIDILKKYYPSCKLTCLHSNSLDKQKFIAINMLRQISKEHNIDLIPIYKSNGYHPITKKKIVNRYFLIQHI